MMIKTMAGLEPATSTLPNIGEWRSTIDLHGRWMTLSFHCFLLKVVWLYVLVCLSCGLVYQIGHKPLFSRHKCTPGCVWEAASWRQGSLSSLYVYLLKLIPHSIPRNR